MRAERMRTWDKGKANEDRSIDRHLMFYAQSTTKGHIREKQMNPT